MILSDREVRAAIQRKVIWITPPPPANDKRWSATTLDLTLDAEIRPWQALGGAGADVTIDPASAEFNSNELIRRLTQPQSCEGEGLRSASRKACRSARLSSRKFMAFPKALTLVSSSSRGR